MLQTNRQNLRKFFQSRQDVEAVSTEFGTTSFPRLQNVDVEKLSALLIEKYDTAVVPGRFFESPQHVRIGMCCEPEKFELGVQSVGAALDELG